MDGTFYDEDETLLTADEMDAIRAKLDGWIDDRTDAEVELREMDRRTLYDRLRRAAGIPSVSRPHVFPVGRREERWLLARPGRLDAAIRFAASAPMLPRGYDGWAPPGATIEFAVTREAVTRYLRRLRD